MKYTSIFEKITCLTKLVSNSTIYPIFLVLFLFLTSLLFIKKIRNKKVIVLMIISYLVLFIITILNNYKALSKVFDSIATNLFTNIYFPSTYTYLFVLLVVDIVTITSLLNIKTEKIYRIANGICFFMTKFILVLIMEVVAKNNIDIFSKKSLFANQNLVILLEFSINIFLLWLISLAIIYIANKVTERIIINNTDKELETSEVILPNTLSVEVASNDTLKQDYLVNDTSNNETSNNSVIEENNSQTYNPITNYNNEFGYNSNNIQLSKQQQITNKEETPQVTTYQNKESDQIDSNILFDKLINNGLPLIRDEVPEQSTIIKEENLLKQDNIAESYTLNDYRIFNKILKDIKEFNNSSVVTINKDLELKLKAKYTAEKYYLFKGMLKEFSN